MGADQQEAGGQPATSPAGTQAGATHIAQEGLLADGSLLGGLRCLGGCLQVGQRLLLLLLLGLAIPGAGGRQPLSALLLLLLLQEQVLLQQLLLGAVGKAVGEPLVGALLLLLLLLLQLLELLQVAGGETHGVAGGGGLRAC
jgi:hypothetical protein